MHCALHTAEGLCRLQLECGEETLPKVCREYPRSKAYLSSGYLERGLSPSCEGVLALLWELAEGERDMDRWMGRAALLAETVEPGAGLPGDSRSLNRFLYQHIRTLLAFDMEQEGEFRRIRKELLAAMDMEAKAAEDAPTRLDVQISLAPYLNARRRYEERFGDRAYFMENLAVTLFYIFHFTSMASREALWKSYVNYCSMYSFLRFLSVMSCREGVEDPKAELFRLISQGSRAIIHSPARHNHLRDEFFQNDSSDLAHMAILLCG